MKHIHEHFRKVDPVLYSYVARVTIIDRGQPKNLFERLCQSIISQQLSTKAAATIFARFKTLARGTLTPPKVLALKDADLRNCGISYGKIAYLKDLARKVQEKKLHLSTLKDMSDDEVIAELTQVKGIGRWTAEMFLMFALGRPDVFSHGDLGLRNAIKKMYGFKKDPSVKQIEKIVKRWSPYRTYASRLLWGSLDL